MELTVTPRRLDCSLEYFTINGIDADTYDFGQKYDHCPQLAEPYGCGCMAFDPILPKQYVLDKYNISVDEYFEVCERLSDALHIGTCNRCS